MHPSYLGNIFHQQTGYYFNDYLNEERLKYAAELMKETGLKMKEIVDQSGFSSQTYFACLNENTERLRLPGGVK